MKRPALLYLSVFIILLLSNSCQSPDETGSSVSLLDIGPWKFYKVGSLIEKDLTDSIQIISNYNSQTGYKITLGLDNINTGTLLKIIFNNAGINQTYYRMLGENIDGKWDTIADHVVDSRPAIPISSASVDETSKTVGLVNNQTGVYISEKIPKEYKTIRITGLRTLSRIGNFPIDSDPIVKLIKVKSSKEFASEDYDASSWKDVGIPHSYNDNDTYLNSSDSHMWKGEVWYRKKLYLSEKQRTKKFFLEFEGINIGAAVYVNGRFIEGNSPVKQLDEVSHVGGYLPFTLDITQALKFGSENTIAVRVSNETDGFFVDPGFGNYEGFGMGWGGINGSVYLYEKDQVYMTFNTNSPGNNWANYISTKNISEKSAELRILTKVENSVNQSRNIRLAIEIFDAEGKRIIKRSERRILNPESSTIFDFTESIENPMLWFPNNSPYGKPYLYTLKTEVFKGAKLIDQRKDQIGIRTLSWDKDYCYVNGKKHFLQGFGNRNIYPALGSAVPEELQWRDIELIAKAGGNCLRVGHVPATKVMVNACDAYGILLFLNSGDNEWSLKGETANAYKEAYDREMIIAFRNHPSVAVWESNNGLPNDDNAYFAINTWKIAQELDSLGGRIIHNRDGYPSNWPDSILVMVGYTNYYKKVENSPSINTEVYGALWDGSPSWNIARFDWENEIIFTDHFVQDYIDDRNDRACGWIDWMLAETQGEGYTIYLNGMKKQKSLGSSAMDGNRIPKLKYKVYENALWIPFESKPGVVLQSSWNLNGVQTVSAWSNCPAAELFLNGKSLGKRKPDVDTKKCTWENIQWEAGELKVVGLNSDGERLCEDIRQSAGDPYKIELSVEEPLTKPNGERFAIRANGSDAAIITAKIVDKEGNLCVNASNPVYFKVEGPAIYRGSYDFYITPGEDLHFHAPGDPELNTEGGMRRIAVKSKFERAWVSVIATGESMISDTTGYLIQ